ncbi:hypothetical protein E3Q13_02515 [Wallemia mellicola]|nr:hypothetical protein E3Q13_02515 [Wallemia mellicola]
MSIRNLEIKLNDILKSNKLLSDSSADDLFSWFATHYREELSLVRLQILDLAERQSINRKFSLKSLVSLATILHRHNISRFKQIAATTNFTSFELARFVEVLVASNSNTPKILDVLHCFSINFVETLTNSSLPLLKYLNGLYNSIEKDDKLIILDILYNIIHHSLSNSNSATLISEALNVILDKTPPPELSDRPLQNASMLSDLETITESSTLLIPQTNFDLQIVGQRMELLVLDIMLISPPSSSKADMETPPALPPRPDRDPRIDVLLDIFPDQDVSFIEKALSLPQYSNTEALIEALLEGTVHIPQDEPLEQPKYDNDEPAELDFSKLRIGKANNLKLKMDEDARNELKATVMRRVEEAQIEEIEAELEEEEEYASRPTETGDTTPTVEVDYSVLEKAYLENPSLFDRSSTTRRSKERENLRNATGLDDGQIEGWHSQLVRNPRKLQRLVQDKDIVNNNLDVPVQEGKSRHSRGGARGRGRGGASSGSIRGKAPTQGAGHSGNNRQRQNKEKQGNAQRKRGHDKKFANQPT